MRFRATMTRASPVVGLVLAFVAVLVGPGPAYAADPTPAPTPTQIATPSLSPPSQQQIDDARAALERMRNQGTSPPPALSEVAGPTSDDESAPVTSRIRISDEAWWTIGAGLLVLLVLSETTRLSLRRAKHRKEA